MIPGCPCCGAMLSPKIYRGVMINRRASLGNRLVQLRDQIPEVEKQAKKTPPKTLAKEWAKVKAAQALLPALQAEFESVSKQYDRLLGISHSHLLERGMIVNLKRYVRQYLCQEREPDIAITMSVEQAKAMVAEIQAYRDYVFNLESDTSGHLRELRDKIKGALP